MQNSDYFTGATPQPVGNPARFFGGVGTCAPQRVLGDVVTSLAIGSLSGSEVESKREQLRPPPLKRRSPQPTSKDV
jgi:hypothetical protein